MPNRTAISLLAASITILISGCASPLQRNTTWYFDIPQGEVRFLFLPKNLGMLASGTPSAETEIEATYNASSITGSDLVWVDQANSSALRSGRGEAAQSKITIKTTLPPFEAKKELVVDIYEPIPSKYLNNVGQLDRNAFSKYLSESLSRKYLEIKEEASKTSSSLVLIKEHRAHTAYVNSAPWYRIFIHASLGNQK